MKLLYFSSTGNNIYIAESLEGELLSIPQLIKNNDYLIEDDCVGIIFPVYYYSIPDIVRQYISNVKIKCNYLFTIASYGSFKFGANRALKILNNILSDKGLKVNYSNHILMVDNYLPVFDMETEIKNKKDEDIDRRISSIKKDIKAKKDLPVSKNILGDLMFNDSLMKKPMTTVFKLKITDNDCSECGICTKVCPRANIEVDLKPVIGDNCEFCLACVHHCKNHVIKTNHERSPARFRNSHVKLSKIIKSNNIRK